MIWCLLRNFYYMSRKFNEPPLHTKNLNKNISLKRKTILPSIKAMPKFIRLAKHNIFLTLILCKDPQENNFSRSKKAREPAKNALHIVRRFSVSK